MDERDARGLSKLEETFLGIDETTKQTIMSFALREASKMGVNVADKGQLSIVVQFIHSMYLDGLAVSNRKISPSAAIRKGLEERDGIINITRQIVLDKSVSNDLAVNPETVEKCRSEVFHTKRLTNLNLQATREFYSLYSTRTPLIKEISIDTAMAVLGLTEEKDRKTVSLQLKDLSSQAKVIRGLVVSKIMSSFGVDVDPLFIDDQSLSLLAKIDLQSIPDGFVETMCTELVDDLNINETSTKDAHQMFFDFANKILSRIATFKLSNKFPEESEGSAEYIMALRQFFRELPSDPISIVKKFGFDLGGARESIKNGTPHLWRKGVVLDGVLLPSLSEIETAISIITKTGIREKKAEMIKKLQAAKQAWNDYVKALSPEFAESVEEQESRLAEIESHIESEEFSNVSSKNIQDINASIKKLGKQISFYRATIEQDEKRQAILAASSEADSESEYGWETLLVFINRKIADLSSSLDYYKRSRVQLANNFIRPNLVDVVGLDWGFKRSLEDARIPSQEEVDFLRKLNATVRNPQLRTIDPGVILTAINNHRKEALIILDDEISSLPVSSKSRRGTLRSDYEQLRQLIKSGVDLRTSGFAASLCSRDFAAKWHQLNSLSGRSRKISITRRRIRYLKEVRETGEYDRRSISRELGLTTLGKSSKEIRLMTFSEGEKEELLNMPKDQIKLQIGEVRELLKRYRGCEWNKPTFTISASKLGELIDEQWVIAAGYEVRGIDSTIVKKIRHFLGAFSQSINNPLMGFHLADEMKLGNYMLCLEARVKLAEAILYIEPVIGRYEKAKLEGQAYEKAFEQKTLIGNRDKEKAILVDLKDQMENAVPNLINTMEDLGFALSPSDIE